jgi:hypothetical protein
MTNENQITTATMRSLVEAANGIDGISEDLSGGTMGGLRFEKMNNPLRRRQTHGNKGSEAQYALGVFDGEKLLGSIVPLKYSSSGKFYGYGVYKNSILWTEFLISTYGTAPMALRKAKEYFIHMKESVEAANGINEDETSLKPTLAETAPKSGNAAVTVKEYTSLEKTFVEIVSTVGTKVSYAGGMTPSTKGQRFSVAAYFDYKGTDMSGNLQATYDPRKNAWSLRVKAPNFVFATESGELIRFGELMMKVGRMVQTLEKTLKGTDPSEWMP